MNPDTPAPDVPVSPNVPVDPGKPEDPGSNIPKVLGQLVSDAMQARPTCPIHQQPMELMDPPYGAGFDPYNLTEWKVTVFWYCTNAEHLPFDPDTEFAGRSKFWHELPHLLDTGDLVQQPVVDITIGTVTRRYQATEWNVETHRGTPYLLITEWTEEEV